MERQFTVEDIYNAKEVSFYNGTTIYIRMEDDEVYGFTRGYNQWTHKRNYEDYLDSPLVLECFEDITKEEAVELYLKWTEELK